MYWYIVNKPIETSWGQALSVRFKQQLDKHTEKENHKLIVQTYDGASVMIGHNNYFD